MTMIVEKVEKIRSIFLTLALVFSGSLFCQEYIGSLPKCWEETSSKNKISTDFKTKINVDIDDDQIEDEIFINYKKKHHQLSLRIIIKDSVNSPIEEINYNLIAEDLIEFNGLEIESGEIIEYECFDGPGEEIISKTSYDDVFINLKVLRQFPSPYDKDYPYYKQIVYRYKIKAFYGKIYITAYTEDYYSEGGISMDKEISYSEFNLDDGSCYIHEEVNYNLNMGYSDELNGQINSNYKNRRFKWIVLRDNMNLTDGLNLECIRRKKSIGQLNNENHGRYISW